MRYMKVEVKSHKRLTKQRELNGEMVYWSYHHATNLLFERSNRQRFIYVYAKNVGHRLYTLMIANKDNYDRPEPYVMEYIRELGGEPEILSVSGSTWKEFIEGLPIARTKGHLLNAEGICRRIGIRTV